MELSKEELLETTGGASKYGAYFVIGSAITFLIGLIDGFLRPYGCNR